MSTSIDIWNNEQAMDRLDYIIETAESTDLVLAQIPALFGDSEKATYLGFRALGMRKWQALEILGLKDENYDEWVETTPKFEEFEYKALYELQSKISADIVRLGFLRNMTMFMFRDQLTIRKSLSAGLDDMTPRDFNYLRAIRRHYTNADLLNLEKAIAPEKHRNNTLVLNFGDAAFEVLDNEAGQPQVKYIEAGDE